MRLCLLLCAAWCCLSIQECEARSRSAPPELMYTVVGLSVGLPYAAVGLIPLVGNLSVIAGDRARSTRLGWGVFGICIGALGVVGSLALLGDFAVAASDAGDPLFGAVPYLLAPFLVGAAALGLGIANVIRAAHSPPGGRLALPPGVYVGKLQAVEGAEAVTMAQFSL